MKRFIDYILDLVKRKFYGELVVKFEGGNIVHVKETKSYSKEHFS
jgi:hypothetical protein